MEVTDQQRAEALACVFVQAEIACGLPHEGSIETRADRIVRHAAACGLEPRLYAIVWMIRKWAIADRALTGSNHRELLDRGYGKPLQSIEAAGKDGGPIEHREIISDADRARALAAFIARTKAENANP